MSLYKRSGVWHYDFGWYGQRYRGSTKQTTQSKARKVESMLLAQLRSNGNAALVSRSPLLKAFAKEFLAWIDQHDSLAYKTKKYYHDGWRLLSTTSLANMRMDQITNHQTETIKFPGSSANANRALRTLRRALSRAHERKLIVSVPSIKLRKEQGRSLLIDNQTEIELLGYMHGKARDAFIIMRDAGMRNDEVFRMRVEFINWQNLYYHNPSGKTKRAKRCVPLSDRVLGIWGRVQPAGERAGCSRRIAPHADI